MRPTTRVTVIVSLILSAACAAQADPRAQTAYQRTKNFSGSYAAYAWNFVRDQDGRRLDGWTAEFHSGSQHRVEMETRRIVADCIAMTGTLLDLETGETVSGPEVAGAACGISSNRDLASLRYVGAISTPQGQLDVLSIDDETGQSRYALSASGIIVASEIIGQGTNQFCLQSVPLAIRETLPAGAMFTVESLQRSFVSAEFRTPPPQVTDVYWTSDADCRT